MGSAQRIRQFSDGDYEGVVALGNAAFPEYPGTVEEVRWDEEGRPPHILHRRWVAEGALPGGELIGEAGFCHSAEMYHPRKFHLWVTVHPEHRSRGLGSALYHRVLQELARHDPLLLRCVVRENEQAALRFAAERGYQEAMREWESRLPLHEFDPAPFAVRARQVLQAGIIIRSFAELAGDPERYRRLWELTVELERDVPQTDEYTPTPFEIWERRFRTQPARLDEGIMIAMDGDRMVGVSSLERARAAVHLYTGLTGVLGPYRRRGIALALKLRALEYARSLGCPEVRTWNASTNTGMLAINEALGFRRQPAWIQLECPVAGARE